MRILVVHPGPHFSVADVHRGWIKGLRELGHVVLDFNLDARLDFFTQAKLEVDGVLRPAFAYDPAVNLACEGLLAECYKFWPDVLIVVSGFYVPSLHYQILRARPHHLVLLCTESPYEDDRQLTLASNVHTVVLNDPTNLAQFLGINPSTFYSPHGYDPAIHHPGPAVAGLESDFCFVGTGYQSRIEFLEAVDWSGLDVALAGNWQQVTESSPLRKFLAHDPEQCIDNVDAMDLYRSTKVSANLYRKEAAGPDLAAGWAMGPREVELAATGTFFLREPRGEGDKVFPFLPTFSTPDEFGGLVRWWVEHDNDRRTAAEQARLAVQDRTFRANAERLLSYISG